MKILVTGAAGFIGYHTIKKLQQYSDISIYGIDNINDYYDVQLKLNRLEDLRLVKNTTFEEVDLNNKKLLDKIFKEFKPDIVLHLAAQAGVRYSFENPKSYIDSNITGFNSIIECSTNYKVKHFIYASSSSVYGSNTKIPFSINDRTDNPISLYACTKKMNELTAYNYSHNFNLNTTGLRFFTVYGSWGRPDMSYYIFADAIRKELPIKVYNEGNMSRDFTHISDVVSCIDNIITSKPKKLYSIYNIGNNNPTLLLDFIEIIEKKFGKQIQKQYLELPKGDVIKTYANISETTVDYNYIPKTNIEDGLEEFIEWYRKYYNFLLKK
jgi:UDP-glucuronate 4-epimerase